MKKIFTDYFMNFTDNREVAEYYADEAVGIYNSWAEAGKSAQEAYEMTLSVAKKPKGSYCTR